LKLAVSSGNLLLFFFLAVFFAVSFGKLPGNGLLQIELQNTGHVLVFGLLAFTALRLARSPGRELITPHSSYLFVGAACLFTGIATEFAQTLTGREISYLDILRDLAGITVAVGLYSVFDRTNEGARVVPGAIRRGCIFMFACTLLAVSFYPLVSLALDTYARRQAFPVIIDLQADWARPFLETRQSVLDPRPAAETCGPVMDHTATGLRLLPARYPGILITETCPDWRSYRYLTFTLFSNRPEPFQLGIRIHDRRHNHAYADRFNRQLTVSYGENLYRIPLAEIRDGPAGRKLDMANIARIMLYGKDVTNPLEFCVGTMRLEK
jgi:hypothetical protein